MISASFTILTGQAMVTFSDSESITSKVEMSGTPNILVTLLSITACGLRQAKSSLKQLEEKICSSISMEKVFLIVS